MSLKQTKNDLQIQKSVLEKKQVEIDKIRKNQIEQLEQVSNLSADQAKSQLIENLRDEAKTEALEIVQKTIEEAKLTAKQEAKKIVIQTIQRIATEEAIENSVSVFIIYNDAVKGRIIGREVRNIRALESATGVDIVVDDTPGAIIILVLDSVRREIARLSLHKLVTDGRIHPAELKKLLKKQERKLMMRLFKLVKKQQLI